METNGWKRNGARGQVVVEVLLILPVFLFVVFVIMEIGHLSFRTILIHHTAYEVARIGSLTASYTPSISCGQPAVKDAAMRSVGGRILPGAVVAYATEQTLVDPQEGCANWDVVVTVRQAVPLVFPITGVLLGYPQRGSRTRLMQATVRMPIERPLFK